MILALHCAQGIIDLYALGINGIYDISIHQLSFTGSSMGAGSTRDALPCLLQVRLEIKSDDHYDVPHFKTVTWRFLCFCV